MVLEAEPTRPKRREIAHENPAKVEDEFEKILVWAQSRFGDDELVAAQEEFFWKSGKVFHDDPFYDQRMSYFLDYFLLIRPLSNQEKFITPFTLYCESNDPNIPLQGFTHSVFQALKVNEKSLVVYDLINDEKIKVLARPEESLVAIQKKDTFQGVLYKLEGHTYLSTGVIFHPLKCARIIKKNLKKLKKRDDFEPLEEIAKLSQNQLQHLRHSHVDPKRFYTRTDI